MSPKTCLCVVFNHHFPHNIPILRQLYAGRFSEIRFLQPLCPSEEADVITIYRGSFSHGAYVTDALARLLDLDCDRYVFIQDDVLMSPAINEANIDDVFAITGDYAYISNFVNSESEDLGQWGYWPGSLWRMFNPRNLLSGTGVDSWAAVKAALPPLNEALGRIGRLGLARTSLYRSGESLSYPMAEVPLFAGRPREDNVTVYDLVFRNLAPSGVIELDYPLVNSGPSADFYILPRKDLPGFAHVCGVLSAAGAFVEVAIGTAMALATDRLRRASDIGLAVDWGATSLTVQQALEKLRNDPHLALVHPVKLSGQEGFSLDGDLPVPSGTGRSDLERARCLAKNFDAAAYLRANRDVADAGLDAAHHFVTHGWAEGRSLGLERNG